MQAGQHLVGDPAPQPPRLWTIPGQQDPQQARFADQGQGDGNGARSLPGMDAALVLCEQRQHSVLA